jgi:hypothetical protein
MESTAALSFLLPIMMVTFSGIFLVLSRFNVPSARAWGLGFGFSALGFMASVLPLPVEIGALSGDAFFTAGFFSC